MSYIFNSVKCFEQNDNKDLYDAMKTYSNNDMLERKGYPKAFESRSREDMDKLINKEFMSELVRQSGVDLPSDLTNKTELKRFTNHPLIKHFASQIKDVMVDMILPETLNGGALKLIAEIKYADLGDSLKFDIENNQLFTVSKAGYRKRNADLQKLYKTTITMAGENHEITVGSDLFDIVTGFSSIAKDVMKVARSIETTMLFEAYDNFISTTDALTGNLVVANYSSDSLIKLCQTVTAYNQGRKAVIVGTPVALQSILPSNANYRYLLSDEYVKLGYLQNFKGYDIIPMEQVANPYNVVPYSLKFDDTKIHVLSPASDKIVKVGVFGGTFSHSDDVYTNANKLQLSTTEKAWEVVTATNSVAGIVKSLS